MPGRRFRIIGLRSVLELYFEPPESRTQLSGFAHPAHTRRGCAPVLLWRKLRCAAGEMRCDRGCAQASIPGATGIVLAGATRQDRRLYGPSKVPEFGRFSAGRARAARAIAGAQRGD